MVSQNRASFPFPSSTYYHPIHEPTPGPTPICYHRGTHQVWDIPVVFLKKFHRDLGKNLIRVSVHVYITRNACRHGQTAWWERQFPANENDGKNRLARGVNCAWRSILDKDFILKVIHEHGPATKLGEYKSIHHAIISISPPPLEITVAHNLQGFINRVVLLKISFFTVASAANRRKKRKKHLEEQSGFLKTSF